ncbi:MAG: hypothetical protein C0403_00005 [Desulfobacterium sp.]|nr:hypothetical protein [Desulfobacterium sp.]
MVRALLNKIMRIFIIFILSICLISSNTFADYDTSLIKEIKSWSKGDAIPKRLLKFPDGKIDTGFKCGMRVIGSEARDYIHEIDNEDLLTELIFDYRSQADTFHAAVSKLISLKGMGYISRLLRDRRKKDPNAFSRSELAILIQLLQSTYVSIQVARITNKDMPLNNAESVLRKMSKKLDEGMQWKEAYRHFSEMHPDLRDRAKNPKSIRTLICYLFDSTVSPIGFDILTYSTVNDLPMKHLKELFRVKHGTHVFRDIEGVYLYHITNYYDEKDS